jgi:PAS domain S-box-containing protein
MTTTSVDSDDVDALIASIHATPIATIVTDNRQTDNPIIAVNEPFVLLTGYSRDEILGRNCRFLAGSRTEPERRSALRQSVANGQPIVVELTNYKKDGSAFRNAVMIAPVRDRAGNVMIFVGSQMEVTARTGAGLRREHARTMIGMLTPRQREVLGLMASGFLNKQIGGTLGISHKTVETHRAQLIEILGVKSSTHAIRIAVEADLAGNHAD